MFNSFPDFNAFFIRLDLREKKKGIQPIKAVFLLQVAVKIMDVTQIKEEYIIRNLHREARIMAQLRHPCIVNLYQTMQVIINA